MSYPIIIHGSENSLDRDAYLIVPEPLSKKDAKSICDSYRDINANLICVNNGKVTWNYKGTIDECNNSILSTYHLHQQEYANPILEPMQRSYGLKLVRTLRGLLSHCSRTQYRETVKKAMISTDIMQKIQTLKSINLNEIKDFEKSNIIEHYKFFAFQLGQTLALIQDNVELFTKNSVGKYYPELNKYLQRQSSEVNDLQEFLNNFLNYIPEYCQKMKHQDFWITNFHNKKEFIDVKEEKLLPNIVIFDLDGTLFDESHRRHLHEEKKYEEYFKLCSQDTPIQKIIDMLKKHKEEGDYIWILSGRSEICLEETIKTLQDNNIPYDNIKLRGKDNFTPDYVMKPVWVSKYVGSERVTAIYDDTDNVIIALRKKGFNVIDVKPIIKNSLKKYI